VLDFLWFSVCGPFEARGDKGEEEYPYRWLGGTGEVTSIGKRELDGVRTGQRLGVVTLGYGKHVLI
jgi:hypothetical protein